MQQCGTMPQETRRLRPQVTPPSPVTFIRLVRRLKLRVCTCRRTCWASRSGTPFSSGPGPQLHLHAVSGGPDAAGTVPHEPLDCFAAPVAPTGVSTVTAGFFRRSTAAAAQSRSAGPDSCDGTSDPEPRPPECFGSPGAAAALPDGLNGDAGHGLSTGAPGPHPDRQGPRCVPPDRPKPASASVPSPLWTSWWRSPDTASVRCCSSTAFLHPRKWSGPGVARHVSEHRP